MSRPPVRDEEGLLGGFARRIQLLERRLSSAGGGGGGGGGGSVFAAGLVTSWAGTPAQVPYGWVLCDGRALSRQGYPSLYAAIGTTFGAGDGSTTFNVPNGKGRVIVGQDTAQVEFDVVGETGGAKTVTLADGNLPTGTVLYSAGSTYYSAVAQGNANQYRARVHANPAQNVVDPLTNMPPYIVENWIISTGAGSANPLGAVVPVQLWQEFSLAKPGGIRPIVGGGVVWDGPITGTLGATLAADKVFITLPSAGTYRILSHLGLAANPGTGTSARIYLAGTEQPKSVTYGNAGAAGVYVADVEVFITVTGPTSFSQGAVAPLGMYDWTWLRIEKMEPFFPDSALTVNQGTTAQRDAIYGVPANATDQVSLANRQVAWFNTTLGWMESYYAITGTAGLTVPGVVAGVTGVAAGWYPVGRGPRAVLYAGGQQNMSPNNTYTGWRQWGVGPSGNPALVSWKNTPGNLNTGVNMIHHADNNAALQLFLAGRWRVHVEGNVQNGTGTIVASLRVQNPTAEVVRQKPLPLLGSYGQILEFTLNDVLIPSAGYAYFKLDVSGPLNIFQSNEDHLSVEYLGPPLTPMT
jgi:microcystin-dependent protein